MMVDVTPGGTGLNFKYWSPMSVGVWALVVFGFFVTVSAFDAWLGNRRGAGIIPMALNRAFNVLGAVVAIFIASYTGVLLSVSNQPVWSDTWVLGGLFLASGLSGAAALLALLIRNRPDASFSLGRLHQADGYFSVLELALIVVFFITVAAAGTLAREVPGFRCGPSPWPASPDRWSKRGAMCGCRPPEDRAPLRECVSTRSWSQSWSCWESWPCVPR